MSRIVLHKLVFSTEWTPNEIDRLLQYKMAKPVLCRLYEDYQNGNRRTVCIFNLPPSGTILDVVERSHPVSALTTKKCWGYVYLE